MIQILLRRFKLNLENGNFIEFHQYRNLKFCFINKNQYSI